MIKYLGLILCCFISVVLGGPLEEAFFFELDDLPVSRTRELEVVVQDLLSKTSNNLHFPTLGYGDQQKAQLATENYLEADSLMRNHSLLEDRIHQLWHIAVRYGRAREALHWQSHLEHLINTPLFDPSERTAGSVLSSFQAVLSNHSLSYDHIFSKNHFDAPNFDLPFSMSSHAEDALRVEALQNPSWLYTAQEEVPFPGMISARFLAEPQICSYSPIPERILILLPPTEGRGLFLRSLEYLFDIAHAVSDRTALAVIADHQHVGSLIAKYLQISPSNIFFHSAEAQPKPEIRTDLPLVFDYFVSSYLGVFSALQSFRPATVIDFSPDTSRWLSVASCSPPRLVATLWVNLTHQSDSEAAELQLRSRVLSVSALLDSHNFHLIAPSRELLPSIHRDHPRIHVLPNRRILDLASRQQVSDHRQVKLVPEVALLTHEVVWCYLKPLVAQRVTSSFEIWLRIATLLAAERPLTTFVLFGRRDLVSTIDVVRHGMTGRVFLLGQEADLPSTFDAVCAASTRKCLLWQLTGMEAQPAIVLEALASSVGVITLTPDFSPSFFERSPPRFYPMYQEIFEQDLNLLPPLILAATHHFLDSSLPKSHAIEFQAFLSGVEASYYVAWHNFSRAVNLPRYISIEQHAQYGKQFPALSQELFGVNSSAVHLELVGRNMTGFDDAFAKTCVDLLAKPHEPELLHDGDNLALYHSGLITCQRAFPASLRLQYYFGRLAERLHRGLEANMYYQRALQMARYPWHSLITAASRLEKQTTICASVLPLDIKSACMHDVKCLEAHPISTTNRSLFWRFSDDIEQYFRIPQCALAPVFSQLALQNQARFYQPNPNRGLFLISSLNQKGGMQKQAIIKACHLLDHQKSHEILIYSTQPELNFSQPLCPHHLASGRLQCIGFGQATTLPYSESSFHSFSTQSRFVEENILPLLGGIDRPLFEELLYLVAAWQPFYAFHTTGYVIEFAPLLPLIFGEVPLVLMREGTVDIPLYPVQRCRQPVKLALRQQLFQLSNQPLNSTHPSLRSKVIMLPVGKTVRMELSDSFPFPISAFPLITNVDDIRISSTSSFSSSKIANHQEIETFEQVMQFKSDESARVICGIFRLAHQKNPRLWLEVAETLLNATSPNDSLHPAFVLIGPEEVAEYHSLVRTVADRQPRFWYLNYTEHCSLWQQQVCDLQLHTARYEGLPNVLKEAIQWDIPFISTPALGTVREYMLPGIMGGIAEEESVEQLRDLLLQWLPYSKEHRHPLSDLAVAAKKAFITMHNSELQMRNFRSIIDAHRARFTGKLARAILISPLQHDISSVEDYLNLGEHYACSLGSSLMVVFPDGADAQLEHEGEFSGMRLLISVTHTLRTHDSIALAMIPLIPLPSGTARAVNITGWLGMFKAVLFSSTSTQFSELDILLEESAFRIDRWMSVLPRLTGFYIYVPFEIVSVQILSKVQFVVSALSFYARLRIPDALIVVKVRSTPHQFPPFSFSPKVDRLLAGCLDIVDLIDFGFSVAALSPAVFEHHLSKLLSEYHPASAASSRGVMGSVLAVNPAPSGRLSPDLPSIVREVLGVHIPESEEAAKSYHHEFQQSAMFVNELMRFFSDRENSPPPPPARTVRQFTHSELEDARNTLSGISSDHQFASLPLVAVCAIVRHEHDAMLEWLTYHLLNGVSHFFIYNNEIHDPEDPAQAASSQRLLQVLSQFPSEYVTVVDWPGVGLQLAAYRHCLQNQHQQNQQKYTWLAMIDIDEFILIHELHPSSNRPLSIPEWLSLPKFASASAVVLHWAMFGSSGHVRADPSSLVTQAFTTRRELPHCVYKSIVRVSECLSFANVHHPTIRAGLLKNKIVDAAGKSQPAPEEWMSCIIKHCWKHCDWQAGVGNTWHLTFSDCNQFQFAQLNHYITKSLEHFVKKCTSPIADVFTPSRTLHYPSRLPPVAPTTRRHSSMSRWLAAHPADAIEDDTMQARYGALLESWVPSSPLIASPSTLDVDGMRFLWALPDPLHFDDDGGEKNDHETKEEEEEAPIFIARADLALLSAATHSFRLTATLQNARHPVDDEAFFQHGVYRIQVEIDHPACQRTRHLGIEMKNVASMAVVHDFVVQPCHQTIRSLSVRLSLLGAPGDPILSFTRPILLSPIRHHPHLSIVVSEINQNEIFQTNFDFGV